MLLWRGNAAKSKGGFCMDTLCTPYGAPPPQADELKRTLELHALLLGRLLNGGSLDDLTGCLAGFLRGCVLIEAPGSPVLSIGFAEDCAEQKESLQTCLDSRPFPAEELDAPDGGSRSVRHAYDCAGRTIYRLTCGIRADSGHIGDLSVFRAAEPFSDGDIRAVESAAGFFAAQLLQDKKIAGIELRLKGNFIEDLISTPNPEPDSILKRARALKYDILSPHRVLVAEIENLKQLAGRLGQAPAAVPMLKLELVKSIQNRLNQSAAGMVTYHNDDIILLVRVGSETRSIDSLKRLSEEIIRFHSDAYNAKMYIGIGSVCLGLPDYAKSYLSAKKSLEIGTYMITEGQVRSFEQFSVHALFLSTLKPAELYNYARSHLGALLDYDEKHGAELVKTLQEFLYLRNNIEKTARTINMSVSGLKYRLRKIEKIIGLELQDYKVSFDLQLALIILQLFGEYKIRNPEG